MRPIRRYKSYYASVHTYIFQLLNFVLLIFIGIFPNQNLFEGIQYKSCDSHSTPTEATKSVSASKDGSGGTGGATEQTMEIE